MNLFRTLFKEIDYQLNLILIHSQDHLMNALTIKDMANEIIDIYQEIKANR